MTTESTPRSPHAHGAPGLFDMTRESLSELLATWHQPAFRTAQILEWAFRREVGDYQEMTNLPKILRDELATKLPIYQSTVARRQESRDGTVKLLLEWPDGATSECVLIPDDERRTACVSTQVGCPVRCVFCASGLGGLERQLTAGQIVEQAMRIRKLCAEDARLSNVVFMGLGEPLANYDATVQAVRTINADWGMGIGARKITVSTVGLPKQMRRLADEGLQVTLALSLHAPTDELRRELIPWAEGVSIESLIDAANEYFDRTGREITLEYVLIGGVNDSPGHADRLAAVARRMRTNVNLLTFNPVAGLGYQRPEAEASRQFLAGLRSRGVNAHLRPSRGLEIDAACGQLRHREANAPRRLGGSQASPEKE